MNKNKEKKLDIKILLNPYFNIKQILLIFIEKNIKMLKRMQLMLKIIQNGQKEENKIKKIKLKKKELKH